MNPQQMAVQILGPVVADVAAWIGAKEAPGSKRPAVLALLPVELQAEIALVRLKARHELGHELTAAEKKSIGVEPPALEAPNQVSSLTVTTGPAPES